MNPDRMKRWLSRLEIKPSSTPKFLNSLTTTSFPKILSSNELRVIQQDALRTRGNIPFFQSKLVIQVMVHSLLLFCYHHKMIYLQGMNEIIAVFLTFSKEYASSARAGIELEEKVAEAVLVVVAATAIESSDQSGAGAGADKRILKAAVAAGIEEKVETISSYMKQFALPLAMFESFILKICPSIFSTLGIDALQIQLASFHSMLLYFEPQLAKVILKSGFSSEMYCQEKFICMCSQRLSVDMTVHVWDALLRKQNRPCFIIFLSLALMKIKKKEMLGVTRNELPLMLIKLNFSSISEIEEAYAIACKLLEENTPMSTIVEMERLGFDSSSITKEERALGLIDTLYRPCATVSSKDVLSSTSSSIRFIVLDVVCDLESAMNMGGDMIQIPSSVCLEIIQYLQFKASQPDYKAYFTSQDVRSLYGFLMLCEERGVHFAIVPNETLIQTDVDTFTSTGTGTCENSNDTVSASPPDCCPQNLNQSDLQWTSEHNEVLKDLMRSRKVRLKQELQQVSSHLATSLILLGFSRVSIVHGFARNTAKNVMDSEGGRSSSSGRDFGVTSTSAIINNNNKNAMNSNEISQKIQIINIDLIFRRITDVIKDSEDKQKHYLRQTASGSAIRTNSSLFSSYLSTKINEIAAVFDPIDDANILGSSSASSASSASSSGSIGSIGAIESSNAVEAEATSSTTTQVLLSKAGSGCESSQPLSPISSSSVGSNIYSTKQFFNVLSILNNEVDNMAARIVRLTKNTKILKQRRLDEIQELKDKEDFVFVKFP